MKYVRWLLLLTLLVCFFESFRRQPFFKEMPMLLLPEQNSDIILKRTHYSAYDDAWDPRPICIQTENNFSLFSNTKNLEEKPIVSRLKRELSLNGTNLFSDKVIAPVQKDFTPTVVPVWATKHIAPIHIEDYSEE